MECYNDASRHPIKRGSNRRQMQTILRLTKAQEFPRARGCAVWLILSGSKTGTTVGTQGQATVKSPQQLPRIRQTFPRARRTQSVCGLARFHDHTVRFQNRNNGHTGTSNSVATATAEDPANVQHIWLDKSPLMKNPIRTSESMATWVKPNKGRLK